LYFIFWEGDGTSTNIINVTDDNGIRTIVTADEASEYTVVYDQNRNTITMTERNLETGVSNTVSTNIHENMSLVTEGSALRAATIDQDTNSGFRYIKTTGRPNEWHLERPKMENEGTGRFYFKCYENTSNSSNLDTFKSSVTTLANNEATLKNKSNSSQFSAFVAGLLSGFAIGSGGTLAPAAISAIIIAANLTGEAQAAAEVVANQCNICMSDYMDTFNETDNVHY